MVQLLSFGLCYFCVLNIVGFLQEHHILIQNTIDGIWRPRILQWGELTSSETARMALLLISPPPCGLIVLLLGWPSADPFGIVPVDIPVEKSDPKHREFDASPDEARSISNRTGSICILTRFWPENWRMTAHVSIKISLLDRKVKRPFDIHILNSRDDRWIIFEALDVN